MTFTAQDGFSVQEVSRRTGFSDAALRYYERIGLIPPVPRDPSSHHRRYSVGTVERLEALACLRASGLGIDDMRAYLTGLDQGDAERLVELFSAHARRLERDMVAVRNRHRYVLAKVQLWRSRVDEDPSAEAAAIEATVKAAEQLRGDA